MVVGEFKWQRPKLMGMTDFKEFTAEVESLVGIENVSLLNDINLAINGENFRYPILEMSNDDIQELVKTSTVEHDKFLYYLSFLYEIAYRKAKGLPLLERKRQIIPSHECLPLTKYQIAARLLPRYVALTKTWIISLILVVFGAVPFMVVPLSKFISYICGISSASNVENFLSSTIAITVWSFSLLVFSVAFLLTRIMRKQKS